MCDYLHTFVSEKKMNDYTPQLLHDYMRGNLSAAAQLETLLPQHSDGSELLVACRPDDYSASAIARAVEDCDARVLALSVTSMRTAEGYPVVMLRTDTRNATALERSLGRYGYTTVHTDSHLTPEQEQQARERIEELLRHLEI